MNLARLSRAIRHLEIIPKSENIQNMAVTREESEVRLVRSLIIITRVALLDSPGAEVELAEVRQFVVQRLQGGGDQSADLLLGHLQHTGVRGTGDRRQETTRRGERETTIRD